MHIYSHTFYWHGCIGNLTRSLVSRMGVRSGQIVPSHSVYTHSKSKNIPPSRPNILFILINKYLMHFQINSSHMWRRSVLKVQMDNKYEAHVLIILRNHFFLLVKQNSTKMQFRCMAVFRNFFLPRDWNS